MPLGRVEFRLLCPSQADANQVRDAIQQKLATKVLAVTDYAVTARQERDGQWAVIGDVRFTLRVDADDVFADVRNKWTSGGLRNRILAGSVVTFHMCPHGDDPSTWGDCRTFEWTRAVK